MRMKSLAMTFPLALGLLILPSPVSSFVVNFSPRHGHVAEFTSLSATWSNGQAIREYQDFLSGKAAPVRRGDVTGAIVVPSVDDENTIAELIVSMKNVGTPDVLLSACDGTPPESIDGESEYPIYVALTDPDDLVNFLDSIFEDKNRKESWAKRLSDLVFFSGGPFLSPNPDIYFGCVEPILRRRNLARDSTTQILLNCAIFQKGATGRAKPPKDYATCFGTDSYGVDKWTGESAVCGKWKEAAALRLETGGLRVVSGFYRDWRRMMWERTLIDSVFGVVGALREQKTSLADVAKYYGNEVGDILWEMTALLRGCLAVTLLYGFEDRMFELVEAHGEETACNLDFENFRKCCGVFVSYKRADGKDVPASGLSSGSRKHDEYVAYAVNVKGLIEGVELQRNEIDAELPAKSAMRQGNLRADGVI